MTEYITTNVRLPRDIYRQVKCRALEEEKSLAEIIRESVVEYLVKPASSEAAGDERAPIDWDNDPLGLIGTDPVIADVTDGSANHDVYLYGPLSDEARAEIRE